ncbi:RluA family pseudouridine synthase [Alcanivorax sp. JB21]|uniref:RluA family pseudouridine synthase n=1 Tax=Alcanivorax limicola TaxID=2874102 RepID=UPI0037BF704D|nr:RluA family pseudouridine synthase [Alcanivorax limicola]
MSDTPSSTPSVTHVSIDADRAGQRLDNFLMATLKGVPKSRIYRIIRDGQVRVNGKRIKQTYRLEEGDQVRIPPVRVAGDNGTPAVSQALGERLSRGLIHEDDKLLVYNKPVGLAVHGGSGISLGLIESLRVLRPEDRNLELVHRLDRDTSGAIMLAKHRPFLRRLQRLMLDGGIDKRYWLICRGFTGKQRTIEAPLLKQTHGNERVVRVSQEGKASRTDFRLLERFGDLALVEATLGTGRTHQIRVHARFGGFPLVGDPKYGDPQENAHWARELGHARMFLHARHLGLRHPESGEMLQLTAPLDEAFEDALVRLRKHPVTAPAVLDVVTDAPGDEEPPPARARKARMGTTGTTMLGSRPGNRSDNKSGTAASKSGRPAKAATRGSADGDARPAKSSVARKGTKTDSNTGARASTRGTTRSGPAGRSKGRPSGRATGTPPPKNRRGRR